MTTDDESTASEYSTVCHPKEISFEDAPVVVRWRDGELSDLALTAQYRPSAHDAFFKLRARVSLKAYSSKNTPFDTFIYPERVKSMHLDESLVGQGEEQEPSEILGAATYCLRLALDGPLALTGPDIANWTAKNKVSGMQLDHLRDLAQQRDLSIHMRQSVISRRDLSLLCDALSGPGVRSSARFSQLTTLYRGKGARLFHTEAFSSTTKEKTPTPASSPPSYDELGLSPPAPSSVQASTSQKPRKRPRQDSNGSSSAPPCIATGKEPVASTLHTLIQTMVDQRLADGLGKLKSEMLQELHDMEERILEKVKEQLDESSSSWQEQLEEHRMDMGQQVAEQVSESVEYETLGLKSEIEDMVKDEVKEAEENIISRIENHGSLSLKFMD